MADYENCIMVAPLLTVAPALIVHASCYGERKGARAQPWVSLNPYHVVLWTVSADGRETAPSCSICGKQMIVRKEG